MLIKTDGYIISAVALLSTALAHAADFPERPVRMIVPYAPGAGQDITGRLLAQRLTDAWSQQVVVEDRKSTRLNSSH